MAGDADKTLNDFLAGKPAVTLLLFDHLVKAFKQVGDVAFIPAKTMIGIATPRKRIAYVTQLGKNFVHVIFPFKQPYTDNLCFQKIPQVPGQDQYNHHFRMYRPEDINDEVLSYMQLAYKEGL